MIRSLPLLLALAATLYMTGVIWFMQLLEYPLFALVGRSEFPAYHAAHNRAVPLLVFVPTFIALGSVLALFWVRPNGIPMWSIVLVLTLLIVTIISTVAWQAPLHQQLDRDGFSTDTIRSLVAANWLRTLTWTLNAVLLLYMVVTALHTTQPQSS